MLWFNRKTQDTTTLPAGSPSVVVKNRQGGHETIIIADDDRLVRAALCAALRKLGYRVLEACSGAQAVQIAESEEGPIDMVLADVVMPSMTTDQLHKRLLAAKPEARIAFMSGYIQDDLVRQSVIHGPVPFFEKPFTVPTLAKQIREILDARRN